MQQITRVSLASLLVLGALSACDTVPNSPTPGPSSSASPQASGAPSASPSAPNASPEASAQPSSDPSTAPTAAPTTQPSAPAANGKLTVIGADLFDGFNLEFRQGMKWTYNMKLAGIDIAVPNLPPGVTIPGLGGGSTGATNLGTYTMEVVKVDGNLITMRTDVNVTTAGAPDPAPTESTFEKKNISAVYTEAFTTNGEGTLTWTSAGSESVSVPAGSYSAGVINGKMNVTVDGVKLNQDTKVWISNGVGMVKEEVVTDTSGTKSTTIIELQSFSG